jgi:hypothetical protein
VTRYFVRIESWAGSHKVPVNVLDPLDTGRKRVRIQFLRDCSKGRAGERRWVSPDVVGRESDATTPPQAERDQETTNAGR